MSSSQTPTPASPGTFPARLKTALAILSFLGYIAVFGILFFSSFVQLIDDYRLHNSGALATQVKARHFHTGSSKSIEDEVVVTYVTQDGTRYRKRVILSPMPINPDWGSECIVHYDPASPQHISTSWGADHLLSRTIALIFFAGLALSLPCLILFLVIKRRTSTRFQS